MSFLELHDTDYIKLINTKVNNGYGMVDITTANLRSLIVLNTFVQGALLLDTTTNKVYLFDGSNPERVHGLDLALMFENEIVGFENEIVWL